MNKLEIVKCILNYIEANEIDRANELIQQKHHELMQTKARGVRSEISEIVKTMAVIDKELLLFKLKKAQLERISPSGTIFQLKSYVKSLEDERHSLALQKKKLAKNLTQ